MDRVTAKLLGVVLTALLLMDPAVMCAQENLGANPGQDSAQSPSQPDSTQPANELPESPGATQNTNQNSTSPPISSSSSEGTAQPTGTAAAPAVRVTGNPVSRPAGAAVAPPKQRQVRSFLIKLGLIAGAGAALGTVAALSFGSPSRVPGSH
jgi:hypothetical protein